MNKIGRMLMVILGIVLQLAVSVLYGFSKVPVSEMGCFAIWCGCAFVVYHFAGKCETI